MRSTKTLACAALLLLAACSFEDKQKHCSGDSQCSKGEVCHDGYCIEGPQTAGRGGAGTKNSAADGGGGGSTSGSGGRTGSINNPSTANGGTAAPSGGTAAPSGGKGGTPAGGSGGAGMSAPPAGNPAQPCAPGEVRSCTLPESGAEQCRTGTQRCDNGKFGACVANPSGVSEACNGLDDDCDGAVDEKMADVPCYPSNTEGCVLVNGRAPDCKGMCALGTRVCKNGELQACSGAIPPGQERCTEGGAAAADENCNGMIDEVCACTPGETRSCYTAPSSTLNVGTCKAGTQSCVSGSLGQCTGDVTPQTESCLNESADDDCNGTPDDIPQRGMACSVASSNGLCRMGVLQCTGGRAELTCVTPQPAAESCNGLDDDCDGKSDETFDLMTDALHCGNCATSCAQGESCCAGKCTNFNTDDANCGGCGAAHACAAGSSCCGGACQNTMSDNNHCGSCTKVCGTDEACCSGSCVNTKTDVQHCGGCNACTTGAQPGCCDGKCVDLMSTQNCGRCGNDCGVLGDGGVTCTCSPTPSGLACSGPLGLCI